MIREKALALMLGLSLTAAAQESPATAPADFTAGFQRLVALGLPDLKGAEWVTAGESSEPDYSLREILQDLKGSGWKIQQGEKPMFLPLGQLAPQEMPATGGGGGGGLLGGLLGSGGSKKAKTVDPVKDAAKLIATLGDPEKSKDFRDRLEYSGTSSLGGLLIHATQLHQTGHTKEANQLAATVFSLGASPESVIDAAIDRLAARDLSRVTEAFFTSHDWAAYERDLRALTERYPRGWENYPAVQMLLPAVAKRVAGVMPPKPAIPGISLHPEALAALDDALQDEKKPTGEDTVARYAKENGIPEKALTPDVRQQISHMLSRGDGDYSSGSWLIEEPPDAESKDPWSRLKRLGLDALPALAAIANDETLTFSRNASSNSSNYYRSNQESAADRALKAYQSMDRPQTRGELACRLLTAALPGETDDESTPQMIAEAAMEFWKAHRGKSKLDLLLVFLAEGNSYQKSTASNALAEMPEEAAHLAFETYILESDDLTSSLDSVSTYLKLRKAAAKDFFARFSTTLKTQLDGIDLDRISGGYTIKQAGGVDKYLTKLSLFVGGESPRKLVLALAKAEKPATRQIDSLAATVAESSPDDFVPLFLDASVMATHVETRTAFLTALNRQTYRRHRESEEAAKDTPVPAAQIPNWTTLLKDERSTADGDKIRDIAASVLEGLHSAAGQEYVFEIYQIDPAAYKQLILARATDRVAEKPPTPLPDGDKVSPARLDEMLKQLAAAKPEAVHDLAKSWSLQDRLAFRKWRSDPEHAANIPASVIAARMLLTTPVETIGGASIAQQAEILQSLDLKPGTKIDYDLVTNLADSLAQAAKKHSGLAASFSNSPLDTGFVFQAISAFDSPARNHRFGLYAMHRIESALRNSEDDAVVGIDWTADRRRGQTLWKIKGQTVTPPSAEEFEKLRESLTGSNRFSFTISVLHRDDLEKFKKLNQSINSEESESPEE